ncbi:MAG TPA: hypothetical protein VL307_19305 [Chitinophagaceae bacterium]|nr:hypothetical protein [Chitinophagaceae bacterium]
MATNNFIELLQETLNSKPLQKVDPNTQEVEKAAADTTHASKLQQAVIAAVLTGIYKMTRTHEGAAQLLGGNISTTWGNLLFGDSRQALVQRIVTYSVSSPAAVDGEIDMTANEAANIIKTNAGGSRTATEDDVITYVRSQRNNILQYLPAALQLGSLLDDDTLDDHTHKMDGPVSGLMHKIEKAFSGAPPADEKQ